MLIHKAGDILQAKENIICHQVNEDGVMGGGLAKSIANLYPKVEKQYKKFCETVEYNKSLIGHYIVTNIGTHKYIASCFTQDDFVTDLKVIRTVFSGLIESCKLNDFSIAIPYKYGCGIAKGNWEEVSKLFEALSNEYGVDISVYKLGVKNVKD